MPAARLADRAVVTIEGDESRPFLDRLVTCDIDRVPRGGARLGALLSPQGKILADFIVFDGAEGGGRYALDLPAACAADLVKRLAMYRLRAKVTVADASRDWTVVAGWGDAPPPAGGLVAADPRVPGLGWRALVPAGSWSGPDAGEAAYQAHRIAEGVPQGGEDFAFGDAFPHEALMDQLGGVDFDKGCYVGQEVVSRMQHRGTARTRVVSLTIDGEVASGAEVAAGERALGRVGSVAGTAALATIRLDRAAEALAAGEPILAGGRPARLAKPGFVRFAYPGERAAA